MTRHPSLSELIWPHGSADANLPVVWSHSVAVQVLGWVWKGYDQLCTKLAGIDFTKPMEQLERDLTERHFYEIQSIWAQDTGGLSSLQPGHEIPELLSRSSPSAKPPAYDLGFIHAEHQLWKWPIEAKLVHTPGAVAEYIKDVQDKFETGMAAPLVGEGGMIGYLLQGEAILTFDRLTVVLGRDFEAVVEFGTRSHRFTSHHRIGYPSLKLHHLLMQLNNATLVSR